MGSPLPLSDAAKATLRAIRDHIAATGFNPSLPELAKARGIRLQAIVDSVANLERRGLVQRTPKVHRSLRLTSQGHELVDEMLRIEAGLARLQAAVQERLRQGHAVVDAERREGR